MSMLLDLRISKCWTNKIEALSVATCFLGTQWSQHCCVVCKLCVRANDIPCTHTNIYSRHVSVLVTLQVQLTQGLLLTQLLAGLPTPTTAAATRAAATAGVGTRQQPEQQQQSGGE